MKLTHTLSAFAFAGMVLAGMPMAQAITISTSGIWSAATTNDGGSNVDGLNTDTISWGVAPHGRPQSSYEFGGNNEDIDHDDLLDGVAFKLGTFTHHNFPIFANSPLLTEATLDLSLDIGGTASNFTYTFEHDETANNGSGPVCPEGILPCADVVSIPNAVSAQTITVDGQDFNLEILGFMDSLGAPVQSEFVTAENTSNQTMLFGRLTEVPSVPEPLTMLGSVLLMGVGIGLKKRQQA